MLPSGVRQGASRQRRGDSRGFQGREAGLTLVALASEYTDAFFDRVYPVIKDDD